MKKTKWIWCDIASHFVTGVTNDGSLPLGFRLATDCFPLRGRNDES
ncbi:MAG: hypothetical protein M0R39_11955 [Prolixibacteraceae bacterium]|jgi:hypothetical protein|nr:hypothetical protein [Prolixibacteraceae bacterium]